MALELPKATINEETGGVNPVDLPPDNVCVFIGPCTAGPLQTPRSYSSFAALAADFGAGPTVKSAAYSLAKTGAPIRIVRIPDTTVAASISTPETSGMTNPAALASVSGTPSDGWSVVVDFPLGGTVGTGPISYRYSLDNGETFTMAASLGTALSFVLGATGLTINLTNGEVITTDDSFSFYTIPASSSILTQAQTIQSVTTPGSFSASGTPVDAYEVVFQILVGGELGTTGIVYRYSLDAGYNWTSRKHLGTGTSVALMDGAEASGLTVNLVGYPGVPASGTITTVAGSLLVDGETFTLQDNGVNPAVVFEFDDDATVSPGNVAVTFTGAETADQIKDLIIAAVNGVGAGLLITASDGGTAIVALVNDSPGTNGNIAVLETVANAGFVVDGMAGGLNVAAGTFTAFDQLSFATTGPGIQASDVNSAIAAIDDSNLSWSFIHVLGTSTSSIAASVGGVLDALEGAAAGATFTWAMLSARDRGVGETDSSWSATLVDGFATLTADRISVGAGYSRVTCPITGRQNRRPMAWTLVPEVVKRPIQEDPGRKATGALTSDVLITDTNNDLVEHDARLNDALHVARFCTLRTYKRVRGVYITRGNMMSDETSDISRIPLRRVMNKAAEIFRQVLENQIENDLFANTANEENPGALRETDAAMVDREVETALWAELTGAVSDITVRTSRTEPILTTGRLLAEVRITGLAYVDQAVGTISYVNPRLQALQTAA